VEVRDATPGKLTVGWRYRTRQLRRSRTDSTADENHELFVRLDERVKALSEASEGGFQRVDEKLEVADNALILAREVWPTAEERRDSA